MSLPVTLHPTAKQVLFVALALFTLFYLGALAVGARRRGAAATGDGRAARPTIGGVITGLVVNFFDTLGIGSFATTTTIFRQWRMVRDEQLPGTLNVGNTLPTIAEAFIYTTIVPVDPRTLTSMIAAAVLGAWLGAGVVSRWPRRRVQIGMGVALLVAAALMVSAQLRFVPAGGDLLRLDDGRWLLGLIGNFALGALMTIGIGLYAPCMILVSLLGLNPTAAFPIMMGSCAFLMPIASGRFIRRQSFDLRASLGLLIGGVPGVLVAAFIVKSLSLTTVRWLVVVVVLYAATTLLRSARRERSAALAVRAEADVVTP